MKDYIVTAYASDETLIWYHISRKNLQNVLKAAEEWKEKVIKVCEIINSRTVRVF